FKIPNMEVDRSEGKFYSNWDAEKKVYTIQLFFLKRSVKALPALPQRPTSFLPVTARW
ncbi:putative splicing factor 3A subunit 2, partial [Toxoplasma gondii ARI]